MTSIIKHLDKSSIKKYNMNLNDYYTILNYQNNPNILNNSNISINRFSKYQINNLLHSYVLKYNKVNSDPFIIKSLNLLQEKRKFIVNKIPFIINTEINNIKDLINIIENYNTTINILENDNINRLIKIKHPLILLDNLIGMHELKNDILNQILFFIQNLHTKNNMEYMHTVLCGPPGCGKTEVAKIIGMIFSKLGILSKNSFTKVVRSDLIAGYLGQTAIKTAKVIENSLGGVLFIDEAYALGNAEKRDSFAKECIDTLCESLSNHKNDLMVIIAGYEKELDECFFNFNPGLYSRFPWVFKIDKYSPNDLLLILCKKIRDINWSLDKSIDDNFFKINMKYFANYGRDIETFLSKIKIVHGRRVFVLSENIKTIITYEDLNNGLKLFIKHTNKEDTSINLINHLYN